MGFPDASGDNFTVPEVQNLKPPKDTVTEDGVVVPLPQPPPPVKEPCPEGTSLVGGFMVGSQESDFKQPDQSNGAVASPTSLIHQHSLEYWAKL